MRLAALGTRRDTPDDDAVERALLAHLCRCTGWRTIIEAARRVYASEDVAPPHAPPGAIPRRDLEAAAARATLEGGGPQRVGAAVACGGGGFAEDTAPPDTLVAVPDGRGGWTVAPSLAEARARTERVPGRNSTVALHHPLDVPPGEWELTLRTAFVEPAYLEPDTSVVCARGRAGDTPRQRRGLRREKGLGRVCRGSPPGRRDRSSGCASCSRGRRRPVRSKRPPIAAGVAADGSRGDAGGPHPRLTRSRLLVTGGDIRGPGSGRGGAGRARTSRLRRSHAPPGWAEAGSSSPRRPGGGGSGRPGTGPSRHRPFARRHVGHCHRRPRRGADGHGVGGGAPRRRRPALLCRGCRPSGPGLGPQRRGGGRRSGAVLDRTIRSFGIITAGAMPAVEVVVENDPRPAMAVGDTVFAAVAAAAWLAAGLPRSWHRGSGRWDVSTPVGPYSPAVRAGRWLVCSGQLGIEEGRTEGPALAAGGFEGQARQALANVASLLWGRQLGWGHVVKTTVFLTDMANYAAFNLIYMEVLGQHARPFGGGGAGAAHGGLGRGGGVGLRRGLGHQLTPVSWVTAPTCRDRTGSRRIEPSR